MRAVVLQHLKNEDPGLLGNFLDQYKIGYDCINLSAGEHIRELDQYDLMLVMGGTQQVWQTVEHSWLNHEMEVIRDWVSVQKKPYFGICFGHQLLAEALGGKVSPARQDELGLLEVHKLPEADKDPIFSVLPETTRWLQWHTAEVTQAPEGARVVAHSLACANQAMSIGTHAVSVQFHAESHVARVEEWLTVRECIEDLEKMRGEKAHEWFLRDAKKHLPAATRNAEILFRKWLSLNELVRDRETAMAGR